MQIVKCRNCGAQLDVSRAVGNVIECEYCHSKHTLAKSTDINAVNFLAMGEHELDNGKFDEAYTAYGKAASIDGGEPEAYFGMALAANKVRYIKDIKNNRLQPICYDATNKSFVSDTNYIKALSLAAAEQKAEYIRRANEIDYIRNEFYKLKQSGKEYDCFICVKVTADGGHKTIDSERANDIYYHLKDKGYRPFYSEREIQNETGADYEARILYALFSSPCMLVVCSDESYLQTPWVKNEYTRFISLINDEQKESNSIAIGFFDTPIERLPGRNGRLQGVCLKNPDAYSKIVDFVNNCSPSVKMRKAQMEAARKAQEEELKRRLEEQAELQAKQLEEFKRQQAQAQKELQDRLSALQNNNAAPSQPVTVGANTNVQALLTRVNQFFDSGDFVNAKAYCNRVLDIDPNNGEAWLGLFMASVGAYSPDVLLKKVEGFQFTSSDQVTQQKSEMAYVNAKKYAVQYKELLDEVEATFDRIYSQKRQEEKERERQKREQERLQREQNILKLEKERERWNLAKFEIDYGTIKKYKGAESCVNVPNCEKIGYRAFAGCNGMTQIVLPHGLKKIDSQAFEGCRGLLSVEIPDGVTEIGSCAFKGCTSLESVIIPKSVTRIDFEIFKDCTRLSYISIEEGNKNYHSSGNCIIEKWNKRLEFGCKSSLIPDDGSVTMIGIHAFHDCWGLTEINIPNCVTEIGWNAFEGCSRLRNIKYSGTIKQWKKIKKKKIGNYAWNKGMNKDCAVTCTDGVIKAK